MQINRYGRLETNSDMEVSFDNSLENLDNRVLNTEPTLPDSSSPTLDFSDRSF